MRRYCFPYKEELSRMFGKVYRPVVDVYLKTKSGDWFQVSPYADSGSDITLFPGSVCHFDICFESDKVCFIVK